MGMSALLGQSEVRDEFKVHSFNIHLRRNYIQLSIMVTKVNVIDDSYVINVQTSPKRSASTVIPLRAQSQMHPVPIDCQCLWRRSEKM